MGYNATDDGEDDKSDEGSDVATPLVESRTMFGHAREKSQILFPLSIDDDLGLQLEQEYQDLGDQGMARKYGGRLQAVEVVPELDNSPVFSSTEGELPLSRRPSGPDALRVASAVVREVAAGDRRLGGPAFDGMANALIRLVDAAESGGDTSAYGDELIQLESAVKEWQRATSGAVGQTGEDSAQNEARPI